MMHVFQLVDGSSRCGMADVREESAAAFDGNQVPEEFCHLVVVGLFPGIGSRHAEQTFYAYNLLPASEHISADGAGDVYKRQVLYLVRRVRQTDESFFRSSGRCNGCLYNL